MVNLFNFKVFGFIMAKGDAEFKAGLLFDYILGPHYHSELKKLMDSEEYEEDPKEAIENLKI